MTELFRLPYNKFLEVRLEFVLLRDDDLQARIMRIVEAWMIDQKKLWENAVAEAASQELPEPAEPEYWCTLSYAQIIAQLYKLNSSRGSGKKDQPNGKEVIEGKHNTISRVTLAKAIHALVEDQYLIVRPNPDPKGEYDALQYRLNIPLIQEHLMHLPKNPLSYLGSNGRINGIPCKEFLHPPAALKEELGFAPLPCKEFLQGDGKKFNGGEQKNVQGDGKNFYHLIEREKKDSSKDYEKTRVAATSTETPSEPPLLAAALTFLKNLSEDQLQQLLRQLQQQSKDQNTSERVEDQPSNAFEEKPAGTSVSTDQQATDVTENGVPADAPLQKPAQDAPRNGDTVVLLIEYLRGQRYGPQERLREVRASFKLLNQFPDLSLSDIEEAWLHGSDDYWRRMHGGDQVHVHDLINRDSNGKHRIHAFLEHKRAAQGRHVQQQPRAREQTSPPAARQPTLSQQEAHALVEQITQDAAAHGYSELHGEACAEEDGWIVRVSWRSSIWKRDLVMEIRSAAQWRQEFDEWHDVIQLREARQRKGA